MEEAVLFDDTHTNSSAPLWIPLVSGGVAGLVCDVTLFPLDTIKTRLQEGKGRSINLSGIYQGIGPAAAASAPSAALFFATYDFAKTKFSDTPFGHGQAAACGEIVAGLFKVPFEVVKQRQQVAALGDFGTKSFDLIKDIYRTEGIRGCYSGLGATLAREIPFGFIQMPVYEVLKRWATRKSHEGKISDVQACMCGATAGAVAAVATTPIDVWKTRLMLGNKQSSIWKIWQTEGVRALFQGVVPRVAWISIGGSLFFGVYERMRLLCRQ